MSKCFQIHRDDNTAVLLEDAMAGATIEIIGVQGKLTLQDDISYGHKVALMDIPKNHPITKYGIPIGHSTQAIVRGEWIHLHNCASEYDARSTTLDLHTGAATDTVYE